MQETTGDQDNHTKYCLISANPSGKNDTLESLRAYLSDLEQCVEWLKQRRVDWHIPYRIERLDIAAFINHLAERTQNQSIKRGPGASADGDDV